MPPPTKQAPAKAAPAADDDDDDPVIAEYDVYITPQMQQQLLLLQYMNRAKNNPLTQEHGSRPTEMRIKPVTGFVEVDVPVDIHTSYNRREAVKYGEALRHGKVVGQTAYGVAGGLEKVMPHTANRTGTGTASPAAAPPSIPDDDNMDQYVENFNDANEKGHVLNKVTYGGQIFKREEDEPHYMIGAFKGNQLHLTKLDAVVQMQPTVNHISAVDHLEVMRRKRDAQEGAKPQEAKTALATYKKSNADTPAEKTLEFLQAAKTERWTKLQYFDEDMPESHQVFEDRLCLKNTEDAPKLQASLNDDEYLDSISAPSGRKGKKKPTVKKHPKTVVDISADDISDDSEDEPPEAMEVDEGVSGVVGTT
ncbi:hypothetical protein EJ04DRAFT_9756 [Polyplosphaeria fusca]|uniref:Uncharacterized protein n=1 Tax=Polyplosphaeria fusca TaxID=682080 RepID=A0A9P4R8Z3_9PLEO|nr:hypothetical protein EJ04DRAFT_9756 [Polyplosphaeria fusca]